MNKVPQRKRDINLQYLRHTEKYLSTLEALHTKLKTMEKLDSIESYLTSNDSD